MMSLDAHLLELRKKHLALSDEVAKATLRPAFDELAITNLKKQKLKLKEEIERLSS